MEFVSRPPAARGVFRQVVFALAFASAILPPLHGEDQAATTPSGSEDRVPLSPAQAQAVALLQKVRPPQPAPLFILTDPNKDPDDLSVLVETKYLEEHGFVHLRCVVATLGDQQVRTTRAKFARSVLDELGLKHTRVGVGTDYEFAVKDAQGLVDAKVTQGREKDHAVFVETPLLRPDANVEMNGSGVLREELQQVADHTAVFVVNAGMPDLAELLRDAPELVRHKVARVVIMGGVEPQLDQQGFAVADKRAYNNSTHQPSADYTYTRLQELGVPLVVVVREAAYTAAAPRSFYDGIAATNHPVGVFLQQQQKQSLQHLWEGIRSGHLPPALTPAWFFRTFTDVDPDSPTGKTAVSRAIDTADDFENIWKQVSKFNLYDPLALLAATPGAAELLFQSEVLPKAKSDVRIIGKNSIRQPTLLKDLLAGLGIESLNPPITR